VNKQFTSAFSLVELTLALGIAAFCLLTVFALVPVAVLANRNATSQTAASNIMAAVVADLRATPRCTGTSTQFQITLGRGPACQPTLLPSAATLYFDATGQFRTSLSTNSRYQLNLTWNTSNPTGSCSSASPCADLKVTWPAAATTANAAGSTEMSIAIDRN
jgi:uncharacterized protein (TIGR02598 family)